MNEILKADLQRALHPLGSPEDNGRFDDFAFLPEVLRGVRIVGLGEGSHGTREHFQFKHRLIRYLVENLGFRTFMIESALDACDAVNEYVLYGRGERAKALAGLHFWTWDTEEVSAMLDWMREHNLRCEAGQEVSFLGFDIQSVDRACAYLRKHLLPAAGEDAGLLGGIIDATEKLPRGAKKEDLPDAAALYGWVAGRKRTILEAASAQEYGMILRYARHLFQHVDWIANGGDNAPRDYWMAENVKLALEELPPDSKVVLWAHNGHIAGEYEWKNMGGHLKDRYGLQYYPLGFTLHEGTFQSRLFDRTNLKKVGPLMEFDVPPIGENLYEYDLHELREGNFFIDLRSAEKESPEIARWASTKKAFLMLDEAMDPEHGQSWYEIPMTMRTSFDGILYVEKTSRARPNPTGRRD